MQAINFVEVFRVIGVTKKTCKWSEMQAINFVEVFRVIGVTKKTCKWSEMQAIKIPQLGFSTTM